MILQRMQTLLASLYDAPVAHEVQQFLFTDRRQLAATLGVAAFAMSDEQVVLVDEGGSVRVGLFIDQAVLDRLHARDPLESLSEVNICDFCTALEGVSHFHYLMWRLARGAEVSLLELELQAEVDKYAAAMWLLVRQGNGQFPGKLHAQLFHRVGFLPDLDATSRQRYEEANRHAARFCRKLEERFLRCRRPRPEAWVGELRRFFRHGHREKIRQAAIA